MLPAANNGPAQLNNWAYCLSFSGLRLLLQATPVIMGRQNNLFGAKIMIIYPDDRVLVAVINNLEDWQRVQDKGWYRIPVKHAPEPTPNIDIIAFYFTKVFGADKWAVHYYARVTGHELATRRDLIPAETGHKRAEQWYYKLELGPLYHKIPPIVADKWRRVTFIFTTGDRFESATEITDLFNDESPAGYPFVTLKEAKEADDSFDWD